MAPKVRTFKGCFERTLDAILFELEPTKFTKDALAGIDRETKRNLVLFALNLGLNSMLPTHEDC